jgi:hypothetical protein
MSLILNRLEKNPNEVKRLLGINLEQLDKLVAQAELIYNHQLTISETQKKRIIKRGGGRKIKVCTRAQIILTLIYLRHSVTFQLLGIQFGISESTAHYIFHRWLPIIIEVLPASLLEQVKKSESDTEFILEILAQLQLIVDSCEQVRERPSDYQSQKKFYSGKKKTHTMKNQVIVLPNSKDIVDVVAGEPGPKSDINIFRECKNKFEPNQKFSGDKAYQGEPQITTPQKKPKGVNLTLAEQENNKQLSKTRVKVEHIIRLVKTFKVAGERFRLDCQNYEQVILAICGLVRLRINALILAN